MSQTIQNSDFYVAGNLSAKSFTPPVGSIGDAAVLGAAGVQASKLQHQYEPVYQQASGVNAVTETRTLHVVKGGTATVVDFAAGAVTPLTGNDTCTVDLKKNGTSILTSAISLASTDTARTLKSAAGYTSTALVAGDWLEVVVTVTHNTGTQPQGVAARLTLREDAQ